MIHKPRFAWQTVLQALPVLPDVSCCTHFCCGYVLVWASCGGWSVPVRKLVGAGWEKSCQRLTTVTMLTPLIVLRVISPLRTLIALTTLAMVLSRQLCQSCHLCRKLSPLAGLLPQSGVVASVRSCHLCQGGQSALAGAVSSGRRGANVR